MPPLAVAGIAAAASVGGALLSSSAQKKAASKAADTSLETAQMNNALQEKIYNQNQAVLNPYVTRGNEAGYAINSLLGISGTMPGATGATPVGGVQTNPVAGQEPITVGQGPGVGIPSGFLRGLSASRGEQDASVTLANINALRASRGLPPFSGTGIVEPGLAISATPGVPAQTTAGLPQQAPITTPPILGQTPYQNAFQNYLNSTGYQFQVDQGNKAINQGYAARGSLQSGAALKALQTYGQNTATGFFKDYLGLLSNQQGVGLSGASATAGVGQNYANSVSANNTNAGNAAANAYLAQGNANANLYGNIAGAIGGVANAFGSSYRPG